jgi:hypothetical protein
VRFGTGRPKRRHAGSIDADLSHLRRLKQVERQEPQRHKARPRQMNAELIASLPDTTPVATVNLRRRRDRQACGR